jgi:hypothetical protein
LSSFSVDYAILFDSVRFFDDVNIKYLPATAEVREAEEQSLLLLEAALSGIPNPRDPESQRLIQQISERLSPPKELYRNKPEWDVWFQSIGGKSDFGNIMYTLLSRK